MLRSLLVLISSSLGLNLLFSVYCWNLLLRFKRVVSVEDFSWQLNKAFEWSFDLLKHEEEGYDEKKFFPLFSTLLWGCKLVSTNSLLKVSLQGARITIAIISPSLLGGYLEFYHNPNLIRYWIELRGLQFVGFRFWMTKIMWDRPDYKWLFIPKII